MGSEFQREGGPMDKALSPKVGCFDRVAGERRCPSDEQRLCICQLTKVNQIKLNKSILRVDGNSSKAGG